MKTFSEIHAEKKKREGTVPYRQSENKLFKELTPIARPVNMMPGTKSSTVPSVNPMPSILKGKDLNEDFLGTSHQNVKEGDWGEGMVNENLHNVKDEYLNMGFGPYNMFNYADPYKSDIENKREEIFQRKPFEYDYESDPLYEMLLESKKEEAQEAYNDGYAQLTRQFDGDIPVNMMNKLLETKADIIDQADSYIPTLKRMAYDMYSDEGNKLLTDYGILQSQAADDYNKWRERRDFYVAGKENAYNREMYQNQFDYQKERDSKSDKINEFEMRGVIVNNALALYNSGLYPSLEEALVAAQRLYS